MRLTSALHKAPPVLTAVPACPTCGQAVVPAGLTLPPTKQRILDAVRRRPGIDAESLRSLVWAKDPSGGPEDPKVLHVHIHQLNHLLAASGVAVRGSRSAGYRLQRVDSKGQRQ
jgi:hypothetical protein